MNLKSVSFLVFFFILRTEAKLKTGEFLALAESSGQISLIDEKTERQEILELKVKSTLMNLTR